MEVPGESRRESLPDFELSTEGRKKGEDTHLFTLPNSSFTKEKGERVQWRKKCVFPFFLLHSERWKKLLFLARTQNHSRWIEVGKRLKTDSIYSLKYRVSLKSKVFTFKVMSAFLLSKSPWKWQKQCNKVTSQRESWKIGKYFEVDLFFGLL